MLGGFVRSIKRRVRPHLPRWVVLIREHRRVFGEYPRILRPRTFSEKILHRNLFDRRPLLTKIADKAAVRSYVEERAGTGVLPKVYCLTAEPEAIPFDDLPDKFVVKPTHGSQWSQVVTDKSALDRAALIATCRNWLGRSYFEETGEIVYRGIPPRLMVEEFIDDGTGGPPNDYKMFVFGGRVEFIYVVTDRLTNHKRRLYSRSWKKLDVSIESEHVEEGDVPRPPHFDRMVEVAETLARDWDFIRVDLYDTPRQVYFGELTLTPGGGRFLFYPRDYDLYLGSLWTQAGSRAS